MSNEFKHRIEAIIQAAGELHHNIDKERKSMLAFWKKQEKAIDQMGFLVSDIVESIDGISRNSLGPIRGLELEQGSEAVEILDHAHPPYWFMLTPCSGQVDPGS
jgi:hypothetical protein